MAKPITEIFDEINADPKAIEKYKGNNALKILFEYAFAFLNAVMQEHPLFFLRFFLQTLKFGNLEAVQGLYRLDTPLPFFPRLLGHSRLSVLKHI